MSLSCPLTSAGAEAVFTDSCSSALIVGDFSGTALKMAATEDACRQYRQRTATGQLDKTCALWHRRLFMSGNVVPGTAEIVLEGVHCTLRIRRPAVGIVLAIFKGPDIGEFGEAPFRELDQDLSRGLPLELFVDASDCVGPSIEVSHDWAQWMTAHRTQLHRVNVLSGSRFVEMTASFVRRFTDFGERMRIYTDRNAFYEALAAATGAPTPAER